MLRKPGIRGICSIYAADMCILAVMCHITPPSTKIRAFFGFAGSLYV